MVVPSDELILCLFLEKFYSERKLDLTYLRISIKRNFDFVLKK